jgi:hypothetical protein
LKQVLSSLGIEVDDKLIEELSRINIELSKSYIDKDMKKYEELKKEFKSLYMRLLKKDLTES